MAAKKRKTKKKTTRKAKPKQKSKVELLKEQQSNLYTRVQDNLEIIQKQTGISNDELRQVVQKHGYEGIKEIEGIDIAEPILDQMIKIFKYYDKVSGLVERYKQAENRLFLEELERETVAMEEKVAALDQENSFYTEQPDAQGFVKMKEKYHVEKEKWELEKAKAETALAEDENNASALLKLEEAKSQLKILSKKRWWARAKNIQPNIIKWTGKISKGINETTKGIGEIGQQFGEVGGDMGSSKGGKGNNFGFDPETIFSNGGSKKKKGKDYDDFFGGF